MTVRDSQIGAGLNEFFGKYGNLRVKRELLLFSCLYPNARFGRIAILSATEYPRREVEKALADMAKDKLVDMQYQNGVVTYSLTSNEEVQRMMTMLKTLDWARGNFSLSEFARRVAQMTLP